MYIRLPPAEENLPLLNDDDDMHQQQAKQTSGLPHEHDSVVLAHMALYHCSLYSSCMTHAARPMQMLILHVRGSMYVVGLSDV